MLLAPFVVETIHASLSPRLQLSTARVETAASDHVVGKVVSKVAGGVVVQGPGRIGFVIGVSTVGVAAG